MFPSFSGFPFLAPFFWLWSSLLESLWQVGVWDERYDVIRTIIEHGDATELEGIEDVFVHGAEREEADIVAVPRRQLNQHKSAFVFLSLAFS